MIRQLALATAVLVSHAFAQDALVEAQECRPRAGLPNFFSKMAKPGVPIKVAYLGGSITAAPGWRVQSLEHLQSLAPGAKLSEVHAAIGGTGSDLGVFRLGQDVLSAKPDLLFVEFAVNDGGAPVEQIQRCMEGIVRQTWRALPECDICFVYTVSEPFIAPLVDGKFQRSASAMEAVANHYGIPSIHMGLEVARLAKAGRLEWRGKLPKTDAEKAAAGDKFIFAGDGVHPHTETGHKLYTDSIVRSLPAIRDAGKTPAPHPLAEPLRADHYERARLVPIQEATLSAGFSKPGAKDPFASRFSKLPNLHKATAPGETLAFTFKGTRAAIYDIVGPDCGQVIVTLDDQPPRTIPRFDAYCTSHRLSTFLIASDLPDAVHRVKIEIHRDQPDKAAILAQRKQTIDDPARFNATAFYPGGLLLLGELVK
ncbi:MAG: hypothetical protein RL088_171 [Verrucomicrobiota bacterium]|jgi:lysophospholipase L1-like esterase